MCSMMDLFPLCLAKKLVFWSQNLLQIPPPLVIRSCEHHGETVCSSCDGTGFFYVHRGSKVSPNDVANLRALRSKVLFRFRKLHLVLDLDHTLVHTKRVKDSGRVEGKYLLKLRPCVQTFLEQASRMFEMYLYTKANRTYASRATAILDPQKKYFGSRIICREENPGLKRLDLVLGKESAVIIVDDKEEAWEARNLENLIRIKPYRYWGKNGKCEDETEADSPLMRTLHNLKEIHRVVFDEKSESKDVRVVMKLLPVHSAGRS